MKPWPIVSALLAVTLASCGRQETQSVEVANPEQPPAEQPAGDPAAEPAVVATGTSPTKPSAALSQRDDAAMQAWWKSHNLNPDNPADLLADSDGDGYPNREEFINGTNPRDPNSLPGIIEGVAMKELKDIRYPFILREVGKDGKARIQHTEGPDEIIAEGSIPRGTAFRVKAVTKQVKADKHGVFTDSSQVTLENPETKETVFLVRDLPARSSETHAVLTGKDGTELKVYIDREFTLAGHPGKKFKVMDFREDQIVVEDVSEGETRGEMLTIPKR